MKHGAKTKKSAKAKASGKKASRQVASHAKAQSKGRGSKGSKASSKAAAPKTSTKTAAAGDGKNAARISPGVISFSNPVVAAAFKRAVKKYPTAFRRLTD